MKFWFTHSSLAKMSVLDTESWNLHFDTQMAEVKLGTVTLRGQTVKSTEAKSPNFHFHF